MKNSSKNIVNRIIKGASKYQKNFVGKTFLVLYEGNVSELTFKTANFKHLCGVSSPLTAKDFYRKALKGQLKESEISFTQDHPFSLADIKTQNIVDAFDIFSRDALVITEITTKTRNYKLGTTDLNVVFCFDEQLDTVGNPINDILCPYSLRVENIPNKKFKDVFAVDFVLSKKSSDEVYTDVVFGNRELLSKYLADNNIAYPISDDIKVKRYKTPVIFGNTSVIDEEKSYKDVTDD